MVIDFSILKSIDFTNPENLLFLLVFLVIAIIIFSVFFEIVKVLKKLIAKIFNIDARKPKFYKEESTDWLHQREKDKNNIVSDFLGNARVRGKNIEKDILKSKKESDSQSNQKDIAEGLDKLKLSSSASSATLESKMPIVKDQQDGAGNYEEIKIPAPRHFSSSDAPQQPAGFEDGRAKEGNIENTVNSGSGSSIFGSGSEVSRIKLEHEMRKDSKVWQAAKQSGLALSPAERAKLVKEVFSQTYGRNISKTDLKWGVKSLNKKMIGAKNLGEHAKIRKEIKFLKKIGGMKG